MLKRIFIILINLLVAAYLVAAITAFNRKPEGEVCRGIRIEIRDSVYAGFVTKKEITGLLEKKGINPIGRKMERIHTKTIENELAGHPLIDQAECYKTPGNELCVELTQRIPILRIMSDNGENYYIDNKGTVMPSSARCVAQVAIVTGRVEKSFAMRELHKFGVYLQNNSFWNAQVEQIHVLPNHRIELVPRVGNHIIYLGKIDKYEQKLNRVKEFYTKALNKVGWNKYSRINVEFSNQIICTKN